MLSLKKDRKNMVIKSKCVPIVNHYRSLMITDGFAQFANITLRTKQE